MAQVAASIVEFGWTNPILVSADGVIIAGHARLAAARKLRMDEVPVIVLDHLSETQRRALILADTHDDVRCAVERRLVGLSTRSFPRPFTIYAGKVEDVSLGGGDFARALTNAERRNQRRGDGGQSGRGTR